MPETDENAFTANVTPPVSPPPPPAHIREAVWQKILSLAPHLFHDGSVVRRNDRRQGRPSWRLRVRVPSDEPRRGQPPPERPPCTKGKVRHASVSLASAEEAMAVRRILVGLRRSARRAAAGQPPRDSDWTDCDADDDLASLTNVRMHVLSVADAMDEANLGHRARARVRRALRAAARDPDLRTLLILRTSPGLGR